MIKGVQYSVIKGVPFPSAWVGIERGCAAVKKIEGLLSREIVLLI